MKHIREIYENSEIYKKLQERNKQKQNKLKNTKNKELKLPHRC